jgi:Fe2+ or Zn2+ uptake regulation protein
MLSCLTFRESFLNMYRTHQRKAILGFLKGTRTHPTAEQTFEAVRREVPNISLGTVYRNLGRLVGEGLVRELPAGAQGRRYDAGLEPHAHHFCTGCGKVEDVYPRLSTATTRAMIRNIGRDVKELRLQFYGLCQDCAHHPTRNAR